MFQTNFEWTKKGLGKIRKAAWLVNRWQHQERPQKDTHDCIKYITTRAQEHYMKWLSVKSVFANDWILFLFQFHTANKCVDTAGTRRQWCTCLLRSLTWLQVNCSHKNVAFALSFLFLTSYTLKETNMLCSGFLWTEKQRSDTVLFRKQRFILRTNTQEHKHNEAIMRTRNTKYRADCIPVLPGSPAYRCDCEKINKFGFAQRSNIQFSGSKIGG